MKILILGIDGYLGWALANFLGTKNFSVFGIDNFSRRKWVKEMNSISAIPVNSITSRLKQYEKTYGKNIEFYEGDITNYNFLSDKIKKIKPDTIVHFAQCPSAPYSMMSREKCTWVQSNNIIGTLNLIYAVMDHAPLAHIIKLGTMGEYGTPNIDIPEGFFEIEYRGRKDILPFPRQANSWYHLSKVHDSNNLMFACKNYGIRCTDIMQGVVFGTKCKAENMPPELHTRLDFDEAFGTVINRFCCEALVHHGITIYGDGTQSRSFLPIKDSMQCLGLVIDNPPAPGAYKVINQFANVYSINQLAEKVTAVSKQLGIEVNQTNIVNPRKEASKHYYQPENKNLKNIGYVPSASTEDEIYSLMQSILPFKKRILSYRDVLAPTIKW